MGCRIALDPWTGAAKEVEGVLSGTIRGGGLTEGLSRIVKLVCGIELGKVATGVLAGVGVVTVTGVTSGRLDDDGVNGVDEKFHAGFPGIGAGAIN